MEREQFWSFSFFLHLKQFLNHLTPLSWSPSVFASLGSMWLGLDFYSRLHLSLLETPHSNLQPEWISFSSSNALCSVLAKVPFLLFGTLGHHLSQFALIILANCHLSWDLCSDVTFEIFPDLLTQCNNLIVSWPFSVLILTDFITHCGHIIRLFSQA